MRKLLEVTALLLIAKISIMSVAIGQEKRSMTIDDALRMVEVGDVVISPDGGKVFYSETRVNWDENKYDTSYFMANANDGQVTQYISKNNKNMFQFSPNEKYLSFVVKPQEGADEGAVSQIYVMPTAGGEAFPVTSHRGNILDYKWHSDDTGLIFLSEDVGTEEEEREIRLGHDAVFVDEGPNGKENARYTNFWSIKIKDRKQSKISNLKLVIEEFDLSPNQNEIVFTARPDTKTNYPGDAELYRLNVKDGVVRQLTDNKAPESNPLWSPDGSKIAYRGPSDKEFDLRVGSFWIMDASSGETHKLEGQKTGEIRSGTIAWTSDSKYLLYSELQGTNTNAYRLNVDTDEVEPLTDVTGTLGAKSFSTDRKTMAYTYENVTTPRDLYVGSLEGKDVVRITDANPWIKEEIKLSKAEIVNWKGKGNMEVEGLFYPAIDGATGKKPLILEIHGGPQGVIENVFRSDFQIFAGQGYAILGPNFRGSTGYGDTLTRALMGEVGDGEFIDNMTGVDFVIEHHNVDADHLAVRGWSWGGVSTSYTITQTERFKAASIGAMVGNWAAETGPGFNFDVSLWYIGGTPWDNPQEWAKRSSITHVKNVTTPSIIFHGGDDVTSSVGQSLAFFTAVRDIGKAPVRYIKFPRNGHGIREPRHRRILSIEEMSWIEKHVKGTDWTRPQRK